MDLEKAITEVEQLPLSLTVSDVAKTLRIGTAKAYELCHSDSFPSIKLGNRIIISKLAFTEWLKNPQQFREEA